MLLKKLKINRVNKIIFGYDIFISYSRRDSLDYAYAIAKYFMEKGYECYIDQLSSTMPGKDLPPNIKDAVKRSTSFVLIGSEGSQDSEPIENEINLFLDNNDKKPLIPITISGAINKNARWFNKIDGLALIEDTTQNLSLAKPSATVLDRIESSLKFTKKSARLKNISLAILLGIIAVSSFAAFFSYIKTKEAKNAIIEKQQADSLKTKALVEKDFALKQKSKAIKLQIAADSLKEIAISDRTKADILKRIAEKKANELNLKSEMLQYRNASISHLESDPVMAYRLAEQAYRIDSNKENRELVLSALSSIDFYYKSVLNKYQIIDFKEPYILLIDNNCKANTPNLAVYDMRSSTVNRTSLITDRIGWIIPTTSNSYRILTRNWKGEGSDAIPEYELWDNSSISKSEKVYGGSLTLPNFINTHTVSIKLNRQPKTVTWDLLSGEKRFFSEDKTDEFGGYFREIYGALDTRSDGISAAHQNNGLVLVDATGKVDINSYTKVDFDPSSFFSNAKWSPDDEYLCLNYFDIKSLGIWNPSTKSFSWIGSPDGRPFDLSKPNHWIVNSYNWSQKGHLLAFSGRTENEVDVTVEIIDASLPETTRKILYRGEVPIQSISFLPGDEKIVICDKESNVNIIDIKTRKIIGKGQQADIIKSSKLGFYSSSSKDFKSWSTVSAPSKSWSFQSDSKRTYCPKGAVDSNNKWMAVPYFEKKDSTSGIELRNVLNGERKSLTFSSDYVHSIDFSNNGNWLVLATSREINIWSTNSWKHFQFPLVNGDRQFIDMEVKSDILHTILADEFEGYEIEYLFDLKSSKPKFIKRVVTNRKSKDRYLLESKDNKLEDLVKGWKIEKLYKYRAAGFSKSCNWAVRLTCRDNPLGAQDCDVQFIPTNLEWLMNLYNNLLWKPTNKDLSKIQKNSN